MIISLAAVNVTLAIVCVAVFLRSEALSRHNAELEPVAKIKDEKIAFLQSRIEAIASNHGEVADILHSIQDQLRDRVYELLATKLALDVGETPSETELVDLERTNEMFYLFVVNNIKTAMDTLTDDKCSVCIKMLVEGDQGILMLRTFMRDSSSYRERKVADTEAAEYPYFENTAFKEILSGDRNYYASNDLSAETTYINSNRNWRELYNSTLVCPIRMQLIPEEETDSVDYSVLGFLCVDNRRGGLAERVSVQTLASIADSLYNHFLVFSNIRDAIYQSSQTAAAEAPSH